MIVFGRPRADAFSLGFRQFGPERAHLRQATSASGGLQQLVSQPFGRFLHDDVTRNICLHDGL
jgi:hypothetical protein